VSPDGLSYREIGASVVKRYPLAIANQGLNLGTNPSAAADAGGFYTVEAVWQTDGPFVDAGIILYGYDAAASVTVAKAQVVSVPDTATTWNSAGTKTTLTFAGAAGATITARQSTDRPSITLSDRVSLAPVARTDGGAGYLWRVRVVYQGTASQVIPWTYNITQESFAAYTAGTVPAHEWRGFGAAGDGVATPTLTTGAVLSFGRPIVGFINALETPAVNHVVIGDSITGGQQIGLATARSASLIMAQAMTAQTGQVHTSANYGWNGATSLQYYGRALDAIANHDSGALPISAIWYLVSTQNDSDAINDRKFRALDVVNRCMARRIVPVMVGPMPLASAGTTVRNQILAMNTFAAAQSALYGIPWVNQYDAIGYTDHVTDGYRAPYFNSASDVHPNEAGQQALGAAWLAVAQAYF
jgi:lysophospholipase L1-like esterase